MIETRERAQSFIDDLRKRLEKKGLLWDRLPHATDIDTPPSCFLFKAGGDRKAALRMWHEWLEAAVETTDLPYRYDQPRDPNFCIDCTSGFRGEAQRAGACQFRVVFEARQCLGEREVVGVSRSPEVPPAGNYELFADLVVPREALTPEIQVYLAKIEAKT